MSMACINESGNEYFTPTQHLGDYEEVVKNGVAYFSPILHPPGYGITTNILKANSECLLIHKVSLRAVGN